MPNIETTEWMERLMIHTHTEPTNDVRAQLDSTFPERDVAVIHTPECDRVSCGDQCIGGCPIVDCN